MKLYVDKRLNLNKDKINLVSEFCLFCSEKLPLESNFEIYLVSNRKEHDIKTTASYNPADKVCKIYCKDRALPDFLRSIAHELTHMMQDELGLLKGSIRDAGGFHEDQANARAGELLKLFAKSHPTRRRMYESMLNDINLLNS